MTNRVTMYASDGCPYCERAERLLRSKGVSALSRIAVDADPNERRAMVRRTGRTSVPQIFIGETHVGGFDDLAALDRSGLLDEMLRSRPSAA